MTDTRPVDTPGTAPGPDHRHLMPTYRPLPFVPVRGEGCWLVDEAGRRILDLAGGIAVDVLGHAHPRLVAALHDQANRLWHVSNVFSNRPAEALADRLCELTFADRVFLSNSGAEANEAALKLARLVGHRRGGPDKHVIVALDGSFHGRTLFTVSVGGKPAYTEGFEPLPPGIVHVEPGDHDALTAAVDDTTCAVVLEPVLGEGGVLPLPSRYLRHARELCDRHGALLVLDEVQTGMGRTGHLLAHQGLGVTPDICTLAKGLGGGFPVGATLATAEVGDQLVRGTHGSTFGGNPLAARVALEVLDAVADPALLANVNARADQLLAGLRTIGRRTGIFTDVRGAGLLLGAVLAPEFAGRARDAQLAALDAGVAVLVAGPDVVRLAPPLILTAEEAAHGLDVLGATFDQLARRWRDDDPRIDRRGP